MLALIKKLLLCIFIIILFQSIFFSPMRAFGKFPGEETIIVDKEQNGKWITAKTGDIIQIELVELGSAGYSWYIDNLDFQSLELVSEETRKLSKESMIGAPVMRIWGFRAKKAGQTEIRMNYYRKWEGVEKSIDYFSIKINIIGDRR